MPNVRVDADVAAVAIVSALAWVPEDQRRIVVEALVPDVKRIVVSLMPELWPDPEQCPDGC